MVELVGRMTRPGAEIAFADTASPRTPSPGATVVLTHGAGLDHTMFDAQVTALTAGSYRVIVWDMRGHGQSTLAPGTKFTGADALNDFVALLDRCQVDRCVLVGHSLGGNLSQALVRAYADRVHGLIVMDATPNAGALSRAERVGLRLAAPALRLVPAGTLPGLMARASAVTPHAIARTEATFARMSKQTFLDVWRATVSFVNPDPDYRSPVPLALVRGARDRTGNIVTAMPRWAHAEGIAEHVIPNAGHVPTWDAPAATSAALLQVLRQWECSL
jgi:pimeloyl-ACP methyl ester carboxylesterase